MLLLMLAAAQQAIALPVARSVDPKPNFRAALNEGGAASVKLKVVVSPEGLPLRCDIMMANGPRSNGERLCSRVLEEARYSPALGRDGKPVAGIVFLWSRWNKGRWLGSMPPKWDPVDLALEVDRIPAGFREMETFHLRLAVDPSGRIEGCEVAEARLASQARDLLCREVGLEAVPPALDASGLAIRSVRPVRVRLVSGSYNKRLMRRLRGR